MDKSVKKPLETVGWCVHFHMVVRCASGSYNMEVAAVKERVMRLAFGTFPILRGLLMDLFSPVDYGPNLKLGLRR